MHPRRLPLLALLLLAACEPEASDIIDDPIDDELPDLRGSYDVQVEAPNGCGVEQAAIVGWLSSGLVIDARGEPGALTLQFADGPTFDGAVDVAFSWSFSGVVSHEGATHDVTADGLAYSAGGRWALSGDVTVAWSSDLEGSTPCTLSGQLEAQQVE